MNEQKISESTQEVTVEPKRKLVARKTKVKGIISSDVIVNLMEQVVFIKENSVHTVYAKPLEITQEDMMEVFNKKDLDHLSMVRITELPLKEYGKMVIYTDALFDFEHAVELNFSSTIHFDVTIKDAGLFSKHFLNKHDEVYVEQLVEFIKRKLKARIKRSILTVIKEKSCSLLDLSYHYKTLTNTINTRIKDYFDKYGLEIHVYFESLDIQEDHHYKELLNIYKKAAEMRAWSYDYLDEHHFDFFRFIPYDSKKLEER